MTERKKLSLLTDKAIRKSKDDHFRNELYSNLLRDIIDATPAGTAVGLFGKWGQGKTSIINMLEENPPIDTKIVTFNAWKSKGDTVRRQLLLHVLKKIESTKYEEISRFVKPGIPLKIRTAKEQEPFKGKKLWWLLMVEEKLDWWMIGVVIAGIMSIGAFMVLFYETLRSPEPHVLTVWSIATLFPFATSCVVAVFRRLHNRKELLLTSAEPVSDSQRLKYPEQFQRVFEQEVSDRYKDGKKLVVIIDDLDRCEPSAVVEALSAIRQFSGTPAFIKKELNCQFIVPCDEKQVVLALESAGHDAGWEGARCHDYRNEELLRKFFDVVVRMDEMLHDDLSDYAASLAEQVGLDEKEAREIVDLADARDPRLVKKLLNALRISHEKINHSVDRLLPRKEQMEDLPTTERLLVVLREIIPEIYKMIVADPSLLRGIPSSQEQTEGKNERYNDDHQQLVKANRVILRAGRVSEITATLLIYGRLDPKLRTVPVGGLLVNVFRNSDEKGFNDALTKIRTEDMANVKAWLQKEVVRAKSDASLRKILRLFLSIVESKHKQSIEVILPCIESLFMKASLPEVLSGFKMYQALEIIWPRLKDAGKNAIMAAFHNNFKQDPTKADLELGFLLCHANQLRPAIAKDIRAWLIGETEPSENDNEFVVRVFSLIQSNDALRACRGFAPGVGVALAKKQQWLDDRDEQAKNKPDTWPRSRLIPLLIGDDSNAAWEAITAIFGSQGQLASPSQLNKAPLGVSPAWGAVGKLVLTIGDEKASEFFAYAKKWFIPQSEARGTKVILDVLSPVILALDAPKLGVLGDYLAKWLWAKPAEIWLLDYVPKKPKDKDGMERWAVLSQRVFQQLFNQMKALPTLSDQQKQLLTKIAKMEWPVQEQADELLGVKLKQLPPNGNTQKIEDWTSCLVPLFGPERPRSADAIRELLKKRQNINEALLAGKAVLWTKQIDSDDATVIANMCVEFSNQLSTYKEALSPLMEIEGGARIIKLCVDLLNDSQDWLKGQVQLLTFVAKSSSVSEKAIQRKFQERINRLIISADDATVIVGLGILQECDQVDSDVMKEVELRVKSENEQIRTLAEAVGKKKILS